MEEVHRAGVGKDPELPWALGASSFYTSTCSPARSSPLRLGFSAEASLCRHDWLTHCPLVINSTSNAPCPPPRDLGGMQSSNLLISGWLPWQGGPVLGCPGASSHQLPVCVKNTIPLEIPRVCGAASQETEKGESGQRPTMFLITAEQGCVPVKLYLWTPQFEFHFVLGHHETFFWLASIT